MEAIVELLIIWANDIWTWLTNNGLRMVIILALAVLVAGCTKDNDYFCAADKPCDPGWVCDDYTHSCRLPDGGVDTEDAGEEGSQSFAGDIIAELSL